MLKLVLILSLIFFVPSCLIRQARSQCTGTFRPMGVSFYTVEWALMAGNPVVNFTVTADYAAFGGGGDFWVSLGFSRNNDTNSSFMFPADVIMTSTVHARGFIFPQVEDRHTTGHSTPLPDEDTSALLNTSVFTNGTVLTMFFSRSLEISSMNTEDVSLLKPRYWIWALGEYNETFVQHNSMGRGVSQEAIMLPPLSSCGPGSQMAPPTNCDPDTTSSLLFGSYLWPMTNLSTVAILECQYSAAPESSQVGSGEVMMLTPKVTTRLCMSDGTWDDPDYSNCGESVPQVTISTSDTLTVVVGHSVSISCMVTSFNSSDHQIRWFKIVNNQLVPVADLTSTYDKIIDNGGGSNFSLRQDASVQNFTDLYSVPISLEQVNLTSWGYNNGLNTYIIATSLSINSTYVCQGSNDFGSREALVTITVEAPPDASSRVYTRVTSYYSHYSPFTDEQLQLAVLEGLILDSIPIKEVATSDFATTCRFVATTLSHPLKRLECVLKIFPFHESGASFAAQGVLNLFMNESESSKISKFGFCDHESTSDATFGNYIWPETDGGQTASLMCSNIQSVAYAGRACVGLEQGWNTVIDFTNCRQVTTGVAFEFYLRFSSNFSSSLPTEVALNNIRITIELSVNFTSANCEIIPMWQVEEHVRVECQINGTAENELSLEANEQLVVASLIEQNLLISNTNISSVDGFCNFESIDGPEGLIEWPESVYDTLVSVPCPFGPTDANALRMCSASLRNWTSSDLSVCATNASQGYQALNETVPEINVINVVEIVSDLSSLVNISTKEADQSEENVLITSRVITEVTVLATSPVTNISRPIIVTEIVNILDDIEEWPLENTRNQSTNIVLAFETITASLVTQQENFTDLTVITEDIALRAERVSADSIENNGRTFIASGSDGGELKVDSSANTLANTTSSQLQNQLAVFTFPSGLDIDDLIGSDQEDIGIFFVVYEQDTLFQVRLTNTEQPPDPVGSAVVSFTIATSATLGLPKSGNILLPEPVSIALRVADPDTGSSENISNAICVFYNFEILNWDPTGCETIYDPDINPGEVLCLCSHLTNFAALVDISSRVDEIHVLTEEQVISLHVVTYVGVVLSLVGLLLTFVTFLIFKKIRDRDVTKFHLQLCVSLACMYIVFVSGIDSTDNRGGCVTVGTMIQYFTLVAWMWMGAEALLMFQKLIIVFGTITWKYLLLVSVVCWSVPIIPVVIPVSIDPDYYITTFDDNTTRPGFCFISDVGVFFGAFLGPIFLVIIFNTVVYILVIRVLLKHREDKKKRSSKKSSLDIMELFKLILSICGIMMILGLAWVFAVFTFINTSRDIAFTFQLIFSLLNAFQGFWIFFFFVLLNAEARNPWVKLMTSCCTRMNKPDQTLTTSLTPANKYSSNLSNSKPSNSVGTSIVSTSADVNETNALVQQNEMLIGTDLTELKEKEDDDLSPREIIKAKSIEELIAEEESEKQRKYWQNKLFMETKGRWTRRSTKKHEIQEILVEFYNNHDHDNKAVSTEF